MESGKVAVVVGRFQPFHLGHAWLVHQALGQFEKIIIILGSPNSNSKDNPWSLSERKEMIERFLKHEGLENRVKAIYDVPDVPDDDEWLELMLKKIGRKKFVVLGDNEWVNGIFENAGFEVWRVGYFERYKYEGVKIRELIEKGEEWEDRVPNYLISIIKK